jgi:hypothetical protein
MQFNIADGVHAAQARVNIRNARQTAKYERALAIVAESGSTYNPQTLGHIHGRNTSTPEERKARTQYLRARLGEEGRYAQISRLTSQAGIRAGQEEAQVMVIDEAQVLHLKWLEELEATRHP